MANYPCELIRDLLPLYVDGVCSEESKAAVEAHLQDCADCQEEYHKLENAGQKQPEPDLVGKEWEESLKRVKRKLILKRLAVIAVSAALTAALATAVGMFLAAMFVVIPYSEGEVTVELNSQAAPSQGRTGAKSAVKEEELSVTVRAKEMPYETFSKFHTGNLFYVLEEDGRMIPVLFVYRETQLSNYFFGPPSSYEGEPESSATFTVDMEGRLWDDVKDIERIYYYNGPSLKLHGAYYDETPEEMVASSVLVWERPGK